VYETKIHDIDDLRKHMIQTWLLWIEPYQRCEWPVARPT